MEQQALTLQPVEVIDLPGADIRHWPTFLGPHEAGELFAHLRDGMPWEQPIIKMFGKRIASPRLACWCADHALNYRYSGLAHLGQGWDSALARIRDRVVDVSGHSLNSCLLNYYRDGDDAMGWHSDNERELGRNPVIASVSLGATRVFELRSRRRAPAGDDHHLKLSLANGSLLVMAGETQHHFKHRVARSRQVTQPRINLTFRRILD